MKSREAAGRAPDNAPGVDHNQQEVTLPNKIASNRWQILDRLLGLEFSGGIDFYSPHSLACSVRETIERPVLVLFES